MEQRENKKVSTQQILARTYIEENEIERIINEMLNSLVHERVKNPVIYMIKYLAGLITEEERKQNGIIIPGPYPKSQPIAKYPNIDNNNSSLLKKTLTKSLFNSIKFLKTKHGSNINHILKLSESNPQDTIGCLLTDGDCLPVFHELFTPIITQLHNLKEPQTNFVNDSFPMQKTALAFPYCSSIQNKFKSISVSYSRNIKNYPYCNVITGDKRAQVELEIVTALKALMKDKAILEMNHITYNSNQSKWDEILSYVRFDVNWNQKAQMGTGKSIIYNYYALDWPGNRSIYYTETLSIVILINFNDHFQLIATANEPLIELNNLIMNAKEILNHIEQSIQFDYSHQYGYMNSSLMLLGAGLTISTTIQLSDIDIDIKFNNGSTLIDLLHKMNFDSVNIASNENNTLSISSGFKLSFKNEKEFIEELYSKLSGILHLNPVNKISFKQLLFTKDFSALDEHIKCAYESTYDSLQYVLSSSGLTINNVIHLYINHPFNKFGVILQDATQLIAFLSFISKYLSLSQQFDVMTNKRLGDSNAIQLSLNNIQLNVVIASISISVIRNIEGYPFATSNLNQNAKVESLIVTALNTLNMREHFGDYFSLEKANERDQAMKIIKENNIVLTFNDKEIKDLQSDFPLNRGVIQFVNDNSFAVVNDIDHLQFYVNVDQPSANPYEYLYGLLRLLSEFSKQIKFAYSKSFGVIAACPRLLGTGMTISIEIDLSKINQGEDEDKAIAKAKENIEEKINKMEYDYSIDTIRNKVVLKNKITIGRSENEIYSHMINTVNTIFKV